MNEKFSFPATSTHLAQLWGWNIITTCFVWTKAFFLYLPFKNIYLQSNTFSCKQTPSRNLKYFPVNISPELKVVAGVVGVVLVIRAELRLLKWYVTVVTAPLSLTGSLTVSILHTSLPANQSPAPRVVCLQRDEEDQWEARPGGEDSADATEVSTEASDSALIWLFGKYRHYIVRRWYLTFWQGEMLFWHFYHLQPQAGQAAVTEPL